MDIAYLHLPATQRPKLTKNGETQTVRLQRIASVRGLLAVRTTDRTEGVVHGIRLNQYQPARRAMRLCLGVQSCSQPASSYGTLYIVLDWTRIRASLRARHTRRELTRRNAPKSEISRPVRFVAVRQSGTNCLAQGW